VGGIHGVIAADIEEEADVVGGEDVEDAVVVIVMSGAEFVAAGADGAGARSKAEEVEFARVFEGEVEELFA